MNSPCSYPSAPRQSSGHFPHSSRRITVDKVTIQTRPNGPYLVQGPIHLVDADGKEFPVHRRPGRALPLRRLDQQAVLRRHALEDRLPGRREGGARSRGSLIPEPGAGHAGYPDLEASSGGGRRRGDRALLRPGLDGRAARSSRPPEPRSRGHARGRASSSPTTRSPSSPTARCPITAEKVAINAVMAGCRPEYMPVVVAAVEGIGDPALELSRARHLDRRRRRAHDRQRPDRARARHQRGRQPLRAGLAGQPHRSAAPCAW